MLCGIFCTFSWIRFVILKRIKKDRMLEQVRLFRGSQREDEEEQVERLEKKMVSVQKKYEINGRTWRELFK